MRKSPRLFFHVIIFYFIALSLQQWPTVCQAGEVVESEIENYTVQLDGEVGSELILKQSQNQPIAEDSFIDDNVPDDENIDKTINWIKRNPAIFKIFLSYVNEAALKNKRKRATEAESDDDDDDMDADAGESQVALPVGKTSELVSPEMNIDPALLYADILSRVNAMQKAGQSEEASQVAAATFYHNLLDQLKQIELNSDRAQKSTKDSDESIESKPSVDKILKSLDAPCKSIDPGNVTALLDRVLQELELIRAAKAGVAAPEGTACNVVGTWIAETVGVRFTITMKKGTDLDVRLSNMEPPKSNPTIDPGWSSSGFTLHQTGGPLYLTAFKKQDQAMATFTGFCMACGNLESIYGMWNIIHPPKDCRDVQTFVESKRDVLRRDPTAAKPGSAKGKKAKG